MNTQDQFPNAVVAAETYQAPPMERLVSPNIDELVLLPKAPYRIEVEDGTTYVVEELPREGPLVSKNNPKYKPQVATPERLEELLVLSSYAGFEEKIADFSSQKIDIDTIRDTVPPYLRRRIPDDPSAVDILREMRRSALGALYVEKALVVAKQLIQEKMPGLAPLTPTVALYEDSLYDMRRDAQGMYYGQQDNIGLIQLSGPEITLEKIRDLGRQTDTVSAVVHELLHQRHAEIQGDAWHLGSVSAGAGTTTDPWELYRQLPHDDEIASTAEEGLKRQLASLITETIAYLGQAEVSGTLDYDHFHDTGDGNDKRMTEHTWVETIAAVAPLGERSAILNQLMHVDFAYLDSLAATDLAQFIDHPVAVLQLPIRHA